MDLPIPSFPQLVFLVLSAIAIIGAILMITRNDAVHSALSLVIVLFQLAGMYVLLNAPFLAVLQVLVYAGAILVLFLFVIMLLQIREGPQFTQEHRYQPFAAWILGVLIAASLVLIIVAAGNLTAPAAATTLPNGQPAANPGMGWPAAVIANFGGEPRALGRELYTNFLLPFEAASLILLVAVVGAIVLARREDVAVVDQKVGVGISLGRQYIPGSPQAQEAARQLGDIVPALKTVATGPDLESVDPAVPVVPGQQPTVDERTPPSMAAHAGEDERLSGTRR